MGEDSYAVDPASSENYRQLLTALGERRVFPSRIVHLWSFRERGNDCEGLQHQLNIGFYSIFYLTQALIAQKVERQIRLLFVHPEQDELPNPAYAALSALAGSVRLESPKLHYRTVAIPPSVLDQADGLNLNVQRLLSEFQINADVEFAVRYQGGLRQVRAWDESATAPVDGPPEPQLGIKNDGVYLITGGAGGLGLIFAEHLVSNRKVKLILTGRSPLNPERAARLQAPRA